ncbi:hypothetical protein FGG79_02000 [Bacillus sp. BHET2]|uniref:hypothetical protein n=1 Tax=Bacillus sp. BHET2 TaxID=2583818 RepID=UPI00110E14BC|nr:hypothetical protein [Bacillus sp. BHET2]TMU86938.1 hypothetical protein FGG79_02000 [Bacillus sp. BHET2]
MFWEVMAYNFLLSYKQNFFLTSYTPPLAHWKRDNVYENSLKDRKENTMDGLRMKSWFLGLLLLILIGVVILKLVVSRQEEWVRIEEKYFPVSLGSEGIKSGEVIDQHNSDSSCAMKFDNGHTYKLDCEEYLDFTIGEKVKIVSIENKRVRLRRK